MASRRRTLLVVTGVAVLALGSGVFAGTRITSPADAAARVAPPEASDITVPVESRQLRTDVVARGDVSFAGAVDVTPELAGLQTPPVVTGRVPKVGDELTEGAAVLEIVGRPVIALAGVLPVYRSLRPGMSGPDVAQLEKTLERLGLDPGTVDSDYTAATSAAVAKLFEKAGYEPPPADPEAQANLDAAEELVAAAESELTMAEQALKGATIEVSEAERVSAEQAIEAAERELARAKETGDAEAIVQAEAALELAEAQLADLLKEPDTSAEEEAVESARDRLADAEGDRDRAAEAAGTPLPAAEVVYVRSLPRRVDEVKVARGGRVEGSVLTASGAQLVVTTRVDEAARELLKEKLAATIDLPSGGTVAGTITKIKQVEEDGTVEYDIVITPKAPTAKQIEELRSTNVRITIPVQSTDGAVLTVPLAALTAGPGGEARVEVARGGKTRLVEVEVGLTADGYAEVSPVAGKLSEGDLVVVGEGSDDT